MVISCTNFGGSNKNMLIPNIYVSWLLVVQFAIWVIKKNQFDENFILERLE